MKRFVCGMGLVACLSAPSYAQNQRQDDAFDNLHACYELAAIMPLPPERETALLGQCSKAQKGECENTRKILRESRKSDAGLVCSGPR